MINDKIEAILVNLGRGVIAARGVNEDGEVTGFTVGPIVEAKQALLTLIEEIFEECKPDSLHKRVPHSLVELQKAYENGHNQAIDQFEANFKKVMGK